MTLDYAVIRHFVTPVIAKTLLFITKYAINNPLFITKYVQNNPLFITLSPYYFYFWGCS